MPTQQLTMIKWSINDHRVFMGTHMHLFSSSLYVSGQFKSHSHRQVMGFNRQGLLQSNLQNERAQVKRQKHSKTILKSIEWDEIINYSNSQKRSHLIPVYNNFCPKLKNNHYLSPIIKLKFIHARFPAPRKVAPRQQKNALILPKKIRKSILKGRIVLFLPHGRLLQNWDRIQHLSDLCVH